MHVAHARPHAEIEAPPESRASLVLHVGASLEALDAVTGIDLALLDGDHNWYTTTGELERLERAAGGRGAAFPFVLVHNVDWPYGRRDAYREDGSVPAEGRLPSRRGGVLPGVEEPVDEGGHNPHVEHAIAEGGPRNGVLTAVEDFVAAGDPLELTLVPGGHGLAILASPARLKAAPAAAELIASWRTDVFLAEHARWLDRLRVQELLAEHRRHGAQTARRDDDLAARFDELVRSEARLQLRLYDAERDAARLSQEAAGLTAALEAGQAEASVALQACRAEVGATLQREQARYRAELGRSSARLEKLQAEQRRLEAELDAVEAERDALLDELRRLGDDLAAASAAREELASALAAKELLVRAGAREQRRLRETIRIRDAERRRLSTGGQRPVVPTRPAVDAELDALRERLAIREEELAERRHDLSLAVATEAELHARVSDAEDELAERLRAQRAITAEVVRTRTEIVRAERSRSWRVGHALAGVFWLLTFRKPRGSGALRSAVDRLTRIEQELEGTPAAAGGTETAAIEVSGAEQPALPPGEQQAAGAADPARAGTAGESR